MKCVKDSDLVFDHLFHNPYNPYSRILGGKRIVEYICVNKIDSKLYLVEIKVMCINNILKQTFDITLKQEYETDSYDEITLATAAFNDLIHKIKDQDDIKWIKNDLQMNPGKELIQQVLKCPS